MSGRKENRRISSLEQENNTVGMLIGGVVLVVIIIILCMLIWGFYHKDEESVSNRLPSNGSVTDGSDSLLGGLGNSQGSSKEGNESGEIPAQSEDGEDSDETGGQSSGEESNGEGTGAGSPSGESQEESRPQEEEAGMSFQDVEETVTAKETTNLRSKPGTTGSETVVTQLHNGETAKRTGINENTGWSRLEFNGQTLYAVNRLLTTDLESPEKETNDQPSDTVKTSGGRTITFTPCDDYVSPKIECNLRGEPSTDRGNETIHYLLDYGETVHRTGYDDASGWSRVEYHGETLYLVTSLVFVVEDAVEGNP